MYYTGFRGDVKEFLPKRKTFFGEAVPRALILKTHTLCATWDISSSVSGRWTIFRNSKIPTRPWRFGATFTEERANSKQSAKLGPKEVPAKVVLQQQARGKYVGALLHVDWSSRDWWGEGDWLIWSDESKWSLSHHGTGTEEYFQGGGGQFDRKAVSGFVTGRPGHPTVYSFHLNDAFQFRKNIRVAVEQMGYGCADKFIRTKGPIWSSTAFWYAKSALPARSGTILSSKN